MPVRAAIRRRLGPRRIAAAKRFVAPLVARDLTRLGRLYGTNKANDVQRYTPIYERHLRHRRRDRLVILEIGIGGYADGEGGSSLRMWRSYFPRAAVSGIDIEPRDLREPRVRTFRGSQDDEAFLDDVVAAIGAPDLVVDDGSHRSEHILESFRVLWPRLAPGGLYAIEDTQTSYDPAFGGGPPGTSGTTMEMVKDLVDAPTLGADVAALHVHPRLVIVEKR